MAAAAMVAVFVIAAVAAAAVQQQQGVCIRVWEGAGIRWCVCLCACGVVRLLQSEQCR